MSNPDEPNNARYAGLSSTQTGQVTVVVTVMLSLFFGVNAVICCLRSRHNSRSDQDITRAPPRPRRLLFAPGGPEFVRRPLDPGILDALPVTVYRCGDFKARGGLDCAVCLSELADGEEARVLPGCGHGFHVGCVDMWFRFNSTCPLCRLTVGPAGKGSPGAATCSSPEHRIEVEGNNIVPDSSSSTCS